MLWLRGDAAVAVGFALSMYRRERDLCLDVVLRIGIGQLTKCTVELVCDSDWLTDVFADGCSLREPGNHYVRGN